MRFLANSMPMEDPKQTPPPSCRKKKSEGASFIEDVRSHIDDFLHASMEEHQSCLKNTLQKMFGISKKKMLKSAPSTQEVVLPLEATTSNKD
ncbi:hypothetical protein GOP47_0023717 [Adiantum capillus-veneris]|uniref:Uncharacterized protein n=1 Tax=Adiantum capillus-veneris TaxID=13818 RepID=A0A9D4U538_ADICA|nr:hypothetical protein GOP47_0023717 [Adiantum capillus-veneris]